MAIINKTGITNGGTIQSEHITRVIDALSGLSTDSLVITGSMTGSFAGRLTGTASFATSASRAVSSSFATTSTSATTATSASFATTASYALNAGAGATDYVTLNFIHTPRTATTAATLTAFGTYPVAVNFPGRIASIVPFDCTMVSASLSTYCSTPGTTAKVGYDLVWYNGSSYESQSLGYVDLTGFIPLTYPDHRTAVNKEVSGSHEMFIKMTDINSDAAVVYASNVAVLLKKI